jgi:fucose 4-O-acetylase-like acetyltransferase
MLRQGGNSVDKAAIAPARGLGIIAVVYGHAAPGYWIPVYLFHMPLFFVLGGLTMSRDRSWLRVLRFVIVDLLLFAVVATFVYQLVGLALAPLVPGYHRFEGLELRYFTSDILLYSGHHVPFVLTSWFLIAYAGSTLVSELVIRLVPERLETWVLPFVAVVLLVLGVEVLAPRLDQNGEGWYFNQLSQISVGSAFMLAGYLLARADRLLRLLLHPAALVVTVFAFAGVIVTLRPPAFYMVFSQYPRDLALFVLCSVLGIVCVLQLAFALKAPWLASIGRASKQVMIHHLFVFALVNFGFVGVGLMTFGEITDVYSKYQLGSTWWLYTILGVVLPWVSVVAWGRMFDRRARPVESAGQS